MNIAAICQEYAKEFGMEPFLFTLLVGIVVGFLCAKLTGGNRKSSAAASSGMSMPTSFPTSSSTISKFSQTSTRTMDLNLNGTSISLDSNLISELQAFLAKDDKIGAIKHLRAARPLELANAKATVEALEQTIKAMTI